MQKQRELDFIMNNIKIIKTFKIKFKKLQNQKMNIIQKRLNFLITIKNI